MKKKKKCSSSEARSVMPIAAIDDVDTLQLAELFISDIDMICKLNFENIPKSLISKLRVQQLKVILDDCLKSYLEVDTSKLSKAAKNKWRVFMTLRGVCLLLAVITLRIISAKTNVNIDTCSLEGHLANVYGRILRQDVRDAIWALHGVSCVLSKVYEKNGNAHDDDIADSIDQLQIVGDAFFSIITACYPIPQAMAWKNTFGDMIEKLRYGTEFGETTKEYMLYRTEFLAAAQTYVENANRNVANIVGVSASTNAMQAKASKKTKRKNKNPRSGIGVKGMQTQAQSQQLNDFDKFVEDWKAKHPDKKMPPVSKLAEKFWKKNEKVFDAAAKEPEYVQGCKNEKHGYDDEKALAQAYRSRQHGMKKKLQA